MIIIILKSNCSGLPTRAINASVTVTSSLTDALIPSRCEKGVQCARPWHWTPVICDAVLAAVCEPPPVRLFVVRLMCPTTPNQWIRACVCLCARCEKASSRGWTGNGLGSSCFPSHSLFCFFYTHPFSLLLHVTLSWFSFGAPTPH